MPFTIQKPQEQWSNIMLAEWSQTTILFLWLSIPLCLNCKGNNHMRYFGTVMRAPKQFGIRTDFDNKPSSAVFLARKRACARRTSSFKYSSVHWFIGCIGTTSYNHWEKIWETFIKKYLLGWCSWWGMDMRRHCHYLVLILSFVHRLV